MRERPPAGPARIERGTELTLADVRAPTPAPPSLFDLRNIPVTPDRANDAITTARRDPPRPLPRRAEAEEVLGVDLSHVSARIGANAAQATSSVGASGFTAGSDIAFANANPDRETVVHEAAHAVQQRGHPGRGGAVRLALARGDAAEQEADRVSTARHPSAVRLTTPPAFAMKPKKNDITEVDWAKVGAATFPLLRDGKPIAMLDKTSVMKVERLNVQHGSNILQRDALLPGDTLVSYFVRVLRGKSAGKEGNIQVNLLVESGQPETVTPTPDTPKPPPLKITLSSSPLVVTPPPSNVPEPFDFKKMLDAAYKPKPIPGFEDFKGPLPWEDKKPAASTLPFPFTGPGPTEYTDFDQLFKQGVPLDKLITVLPSDESKLDFTRKYLYYAEKQNKKDEADAATALKPKLEKKVDAAKAEQSKLAELIAAAKDAEKQQHDAAVADARQKLALPQTKQIVSPAMKTAEFLGPIAKPIILVTSKVIDFAVDFIPVVGEVKMAIEAITGRTMSGQLELAMNNPFMHKLPPDLDTADRVLGAILVLLPGVKKIVSATAKAGATILEIASRSGKSIDEAAQVVVEIDKLSSKAKDIEKAKALLEEAQKTEKAVGKTGDALATGAKDSGAATKGIDNAGEKLPKAVETVIGGACFVPGTPVWTATGPRPIETLAPGDRVLAFDLERRIVGEQPIVQVFSNVVPSVLDLDLGGEALTCSPEHPFWTQRGWRTAAELVAGDRLRTREHDTLAFVSSRKRRGEHRVHNIEVVGLANYFVGVQAILVHNKSAKAFEYTELPEKVRKAFSPKEVDQIVNKGWKAGWDNEQILKFLKDSSKPDEQIIARIFGADGPLVFRDLPLDQVERLMKKYGSGLAAALHDRGTIASYEALSAMVKGLGGRFQAHHIIEQQVLKVLGHDTMIAPSVILSLEEHQKITKELAKLLPPGEIADMTKKEILDAYKTAYKNYPQWLAEVKRYF